MGDVDRIREKFEVLRHVMDERVTRLWAAAEAMALGRGGAAIVTAATGIRGKRIWLWGSATWKRLPPVRRRRSRSISAFVGLERAGLR